MRYRTRKILLADDSRGVLELMTRLLDRMGFSVLQAENGAEALRALESGAAPDLMILDVYMPELDGPSTLEVVKSNSETSDIPVVMFSVDTKDELINRCKRLGCDDYLGKPINIDDLHDMLQKVLFSGFGQTRRHVRADFDGSVKVYFGGKAEELKVTTVSEGGIYLLRDEPLPVGTQLVVRIELDRDRAVELSGMVIYTNPSVGPGSEVPPGMAVEFMDITSQDASTLSVYIKNILTR